MLRFALPLALSLAASTATAQCFEANFGTSLTLPATFDFVLGGQPIGFAFPLAGTTYSEVHICSKGYVWLANAGVPAPGVADYTATAGELASQGPRIAPLWSDLVPGVGGSIHINSTATRCVVTWQNIECYFGTCGAFTMQLQMMASGEVFFFWGAGATNNSDPVQPTWQVGVCGISPGGAALPATSDLSASGVTIDNTLVEQWLVPNTFDMAIRSLHLIPTNPGWVFAPPTGCAGTSTYGTGCVQADDSFYEAWTSGFDFNNRTLTWLRTGSGYGVSTSNPGTFVTPSAGAINLAAGQLDGEQVVTLSAPMPVAGGATTTLNVTTKGYIEVAATTSGVFPDYTPSIGELLNSARTRFALWHDYDQSAIGSGLILYEEVAGIAYVTWNGVQSFAVSTTSTFQFQFDVATGNVTLVIGTMGGFANPDAGILGYSVGGASPDPGPTDLSTLAGSITISDVGSVPLTLDGVGLPLIGNASFTLATSNVPNLVPLAIVFFGTAVVDPGIDLTFLGMPGCFGYSNANLASLTFPVVAGAGTVGLAIPNNPSLAGSVLSAQSVGFTPATPFNLASSNGLQISIGN